MSIIKPMRAENAVLSKIPRWPVWAEPKIDGVRGYNPDGTLYARTLKRHANQATTFFFSRPEYAGLDGELAASHEIDPALCRKTTSALTTQEGSPYITWHLFDYVTAETINLPYSQRKRLLTHKYTDLCDAGIAGHLALVAHTICNNEKELMEAHTRNMLLGYEGTCYYDPTVAHKEGKSSPRHGGVLRIKDFVDCEVIVTAIEEGNHNGNPAQINELGRTFRSSHQENQIPNGMVGNMTCYSLADVFDLHDKKKLLVAKDQVFTISPGKMTEAEARDFFINQDKILHRPSKVKFFPKGMKDAPRFPQWQCLRAPEDM